MKIMLIQPSANRLTNRFATRYHFTPLGLALVAAYTPTEYDVVIFDEAFKELVLNDHLDVDLVGISAFTSNVKRGYEIADFYRSRGIPVVMGGHHVSSLPEEALQHADAVVVGEADLVWGKVLDDFSKGKMKGTYKASCVYDLRNMPHARIDLYPKDVDYMIRPNIHFTRGCPHNCTFCSATIFFGKSFRKRPVDEVINEFKSIKENYVDETNRVVLNDDNPTLDKKYAKELFGKMIPLGLKWQAFAGIDIADDNELLGICKDAGCLGFFIGFDALNEEDLSLTNKKVNRRYDYIKAVRKIQEEYGIPVIAAMMVGFDHDTTATFDTIMNFLNESRASSMNLNILYPYPGTPIFDQLTQEGRITSRDWDNYVMDGVNYLPARMTQDELHDGYLKVLEWFSTDDAIAKRTEYAQQTSMGSHCANMVSSWGMGIKRQYEECLRGENKVRRPNEECV
jgi:radical SAM superfamily enzyme YgiQ (UPF0313 family)